MQTWRAGWAAAERRIGHSAPESHLQDGTLSGPTQGDNITKKHALLLACLLLFSKA